MQHLSDTELQEWVLSPSQSSATVVAHISHCPDCKSKVESYRALFTAIHDQPKAAFNFDLPLLVIPQLAQTKPAAADRFIAGFLVIFVSAFIGIPVYVFRSYILNIFDGIPSYFIYVIVISAIIILAAYSLDIFYKYRKQMRLLNFHPHY